MSSFRKYLFGVLFLLALGSFGYSSIGYGLEHRALDFFTAHHAPHPDVVILAVDNKALSEIGRWPWKRSVHAEIIRRLGDSAPWVLGFDVNFTEAEDPEDDAALAARVAQAKFPIVFPAEAVYTSGGGRPEKVLVPIEPIASAPTVSLGSVNAVLTPDGFARDFPASISSAGKIFLPFSFEIAKRVRTELPTGGDYGVNFAGPAGSFPTFSLADFLAGRISGEKLQGKIVLIGATASDLHDTLPVPFGAGLISGIEWHANVLDNILLGRPLKNIPQSFSVLGSLVLGAFLLLLFDRLTVRRAIAVLAGTLLFFPALSFGLMRVGIAFPYLLETLASVGAFGIQGLSKWYRAEQEKKKLRMTFQNYFSPQVLEAIIKNPASLALGGERREVTVFFSDIRSFTTITEATDPETLSRLLREYFTEMAEEIFATDGVVDKFIGDSIMAFWGAPLEQRDQADRAVRASIGMIKRLKILQTSWRERGLPVIDIGIGVNTGLATVGNLGSEKRFDYTVIGDSVNAAARLEGLNKEHASHIIISESTKNKLTGTYALRPLGEVVVKGKTVPLKIFEVVVD